jgi:predicted MFS family arabinose efflux permease
MPSDHGHPNVLPNDCSRPSPTARSRLNALLLGTMFVGMSAGSALGSIALDRFGWRGVGVFGMVTAAAALVLRLRRHSWNQ